MIEVNAKNVIGDEKQKQKYNLSITIYVCSILHRLYIYITKR